MLEAAGCGCSEVGCSDGFTVALGKDSKVWEPGSYVVSVDADGVEKSCTFDVPLVDAADCTSGIQVQLSLAFLSGSSTETRNAGSVSISGTPAGVQVTVARDGVPLGTGYFVPTYTVVEPNGEICGPTCHVSSSDLSVP